MSQRYRIDGGLVDHARALNFSFDGERMSALAGDTLASALLANGKRLVARSFKYHRPRGIFTAGSEEPNALVHLRSGAHTEPNTRATVVEMFDGLEANPQNFRGSLKNDFLAVNDFLAPFLSAGWRICSVRRSPFTWARPHCSDSARSSRSRSPEGSCMSGSATST